MPKFVPVVKVNRFLRSAGSKFFTVTFSKLDNTKRQLTCRLGVESDLKGGESTTAHIKLIQNVWTPKGRKCFYKDRVYTLKQGDKIVKA